MVKLRDYPLQKFQFKPSPGTFGIEIETEVEKATSYPEGFLNPKECGDTGQFVPELNKYVKHYDVWNKSWKGVLDGSLRNFGVEYIVKKPHTYEGILHAVDEFAEYTKDIPFIENAPGTSVHVHINMQDEEVLTIFTYITVWTLFENLLIEFCGENRRTNLFALPTRVCEGNLSIYMQMVDQYLNRTQAFYMSEGAAKYSALNVVPLHKLGSIEVRTMRGTTDPDVLKKWLTILNDILVYSRGRKPSEVLREYRSVGPSGMIDRVFSDKSFLSSIDNHEARIDYMLEQVYLFVSSFDWDEVRNKTFEIKDKKKTLTTEEQLHEYIQTMQSGGLNGLSPSHMIVDEFSEPSFDDEYPEEEEE